MPASPLIIPGLGNSGPDHWQTLWEEALPGSVRVEQEDWANPHPSTWMPALSVALSHVEPPVILVAHSLGCILVNWWARIADQDELDRIGAALLVAPPDVEDETCTPLETRCFAPIPMDPLPFPTYVVASRTDPYCSYLRAHGMAEAWGARLEDAGEAGHINADSGHGAFRLGEQLYMGLVVALSK